MSIKSFNESDKQPSISLFELQVDAYSWASACKIENEVIRSIPEQRAYRLSYFNNANFIDLGRKKKSR